MINLSCDFIHLSIYPTEGKLSEGWHENLLEIRISLNHTTRKTETPRNAYYPANSS